MTREEVIKYLNTLYMAFAVFPNQQISLGNIDELKESVSMAIKALEQEPCEDTVSRKEIIEHYTTGEMANVHHIDKNHLLAFVEQLPPVRPQEPQESEESK